MVRYNGYIRVKNTSEKLQAWMKDNGLVGYKIAGRFVKYDPRTMSLFSTSLYGD